MKRNALILISILILLIGSLVIVKSIQRPVAPTISPILSQETAQSKKLEDQVSSTTQITSETMLPTSSLIPEDKAPIESKENAVIIKGKIINEQKAPIKEAKVNFVITKLKKPESEVPQQQKFQEKSDKDGQYTITLKQDDYNVLIRASAEGYVENSLLFNISSKNTLVDNKDIILKLGKTISGIIVNRTDKPISDAEVQALPRMTPHRSYPYGAYPKMTRSDNAGKFIFHSLHDDTYALFITAQGYEREILNDIPAGKTDLKIVLEEGNGGRVLGNVINKTSNAPVADIEVFISIASGFHIASKTDSNGKFEFTNVPEGSWLILVQKENLIQRLPTNISISKGQIIDNVVIELEEPYTISGKVLEKDNNKPIPNAKLEIMAYGGKKETTSDTNGDYVFNNILPQNTSYPILDINAFSDNFVVDYVMDINEGPYRRIMLREEHNLTGIDIYMKKGVQVSGIVLTPEKMPVANANVRVFTSNMRTYSRRDYETDQSGKFRIVFEPNTAVRFTAKKEGYAETLSDYCLIKDKPVNDIVIVLKKGGVIDGIVFGLSHSPVPDASVSLYTICADSPFSQPVGYKRIRTDDAGKFRFVDVTPGKVTVYAEKEDYGKTESVTVEMKENGESKGINLFFSQKLSISGKVTDENKNPIPEASISGNSPEIQMNANTMSDENGNYELKGLKEGYYQLYAQASNHIPENKQKIKAGSKNVDFVLKLCKKEKIRGKVVDKKTSEPIRIFTITHEANSYSFNNPEGKFEIEDELLIPTTITVSAENYLPNTTYLNYDNITTLIIRLDKGGIVKGRVLSKRDNTPINRAKVSISATFCCDFHFAETAKSTYTRESGEFYFEGVFSGHNILFLEANGFASKTQDVNVNPGEVQDLGNIYLVSGGRIFGRVYDEDKKPLRDVLINLTISRYFRQAPMNEITNENGYYEFKNLSSGQATISIAKIPQITKSFQFNEEEDKQIDLYITQTVVNIQVVKKDEPLQKAFITGYFSEGDYFYGTTDENGKATIKGVKGAKYTVNVNYEGSNIFTKEVEIKENIENNYLFEIPDAIIGGKILDIDGKPIPNIFVYLSPIQIEQPRYSFRPSQTDNAGYFEFQNISEGDYIISASINNQNSNMVMKKISIGLDETRNDLLLRFGEGTVLDLLIRDKETNAPINNAGVRFDNKWARSGADGKISISGIPSGDYQISVYANGYSETKEEIFIAENQKVSREIYLLKFVQ